MSLPIFQIKRRNKNTNEEYSTNQKLNGLIDGELGYNYYDNSLWIGPYNETTGENYAILVNENHQINNSKWTNGTTSGPQLALHQYDSRSQSGGWFNVNVIPTATDSQSGVITTGAQNFAGVKTFKNGLTVTNSAGTSNIAKIDTNGYIEGTLLKTTGATELNSTSKVAVIKDGWIHYITPSNLIAGITKFTGDLVGNATTASALTALSSTDNASSTTTQRYVFIAHNDNTTGRPAYDQRFTFQTSSGILSTPSIQLNGDIKFVNSNNPYSMIKFLTGDVNGAGVVIGGGGLTVLGSGESASNLTTALSKSGSDEETYITSDSNIQFFTNCQNITDRKGAILDEALAFRPINDKMGSIGTNTYRWKNGHFNESIKIGDYSTVHAKTTRMVDATGLDQSTYYPVTISLLQRNARITLAVGLDSGSKPSWSTHDNGFSAHIDVEMIGAGWGTSTPLFIKYVDDYSWANVKPAHFCGQLTNSSKALFYVRGGGKYRFYCDWAEASVALHTALTTLSDQTFGPTTDTPPFWSASVSSIQANLNGNASTATKLETARTISLTGDVTGSTTFDGSDNVNITATVADDSHNHIISNVDGLQTALDSKFTIYGHTGGIDLNTLKTNGSYYISDNAINKPQPYSQLLVMRNGDTTGQLVIPYASGHYMQYRGASDNGGFYAWRTLLDSSNYSSYALPLIGGILTGALTVSTPAMSISAGKVTGLTAGTSQLYANGLVISNPTTANDVGWIRVTGTGESDTVLEIATGDDGGGTSCEKIVARQYNTSNAVAREAILLNTNGTTSFPVSVTAPTFIGALTGNASNATTFGDDSLKVYVTAGNEINFGGTYNSSSIFFGYRAKDSKPIPSRFYFGGTYGTGTVVAKTFEGTATNATKATTATKATQDENGNNIVSTYQKQADAVGKKCTYRNPTGAEIFNNYSNIAEANYSTAMGSGTWAWQLGECVVGLYNQHKTYTNDNEQFVIGNGYVANGEEIRGNALVVTNKGHGYFKGFSTSSGADYAEYFEWEDSNMNHDDRRGYFVTLNKNKIKIAKSDDYILGVVSGNPSVIGNGDIDWQGRYLKDEFDSIIQTKIECEEQIIDEEGKIQTITRTMLKDKENPEYDAKRPYVSRSDRPEWDAIGMIGVLAVRDDGTCQVNSYCKVTDEGIATASDTGYRVITRVNDRVIKIILK